MRSKIIAHLDMDAFFASVEERDKPWLKGLPIVVGSDPLGGEGRGVVSTANYKARAYGIKSALPIRKAWEYSERARKVGKPAAAFIVPRSKKYGDISKMIMEMLRMHTPLVYQTSVDEAYFDLTHTHSFKRAKERAREIKGEIKKELGLTCSIGIAPNKMVAKIASDFRKPDGLTVVKPRMVETFLDPLPLRALPGLGPKAEQKLNRIHVYTVRDLKMLSWEKLEELFGSLGFSLYQKARGIASDTLATAHEPAKSIGEHDTFAEDTTNLNFVLGRLAHMAEHIIERMRKAGFREFRTIVLTVRFADFETKTRSLTTAEAALCLEDLERRATKLVLPFFEKRENPHKKKIRMVGLRIEKLA